jgi:hypothetical protein
MRMSQAGRAYRSLNRVEFEPDRRIAWRSTGTSFGRIGIGEPAPREVLSFLAGLDRKRVFADPTFTLDYVNRRPGIITITRDQVHSAMTFDYDKSGRIVAICVVSAPSMLAHISR